MEFFLLFSVNPRSGPDIYWTGMDNNAKYNVVRMNSIF